MGTPEEKARKRKRIKSHIAKDLRTPKFKQRIVKDKKKQVDSDKLTHADLVKLLNEKEDDNTPD